MAILMYPIFLVIFWYKNVVAQTFEFLFSFLVYILNLLSVPILLKTFFKPLKNEYRQGLVGFSIIIGIFVKSILIVINFSLFIIFLFISLIIFFAVLLMPLLAAYILFW